ncbi:Arm DNA-binding domain-containing protein [Saccharococcus caldoxylosilyticus]|uniref:AP2-like integrase N-terminal domain-containing protein n=1 Tax=Parageobacillus caldoxylosilyticus NBRC 107762 TaxID=1220594 RepID=A0A023DJZ6_9BACL|nr:Arm DNA-binding domain-containing protein [Parageobacillus caldoxylosilyticus]GAJ41592.1 hypothetical protein GCA01S_078_00060 [Parageobacillus caldoxylosilyticus NBRC 107762]
MDSLIRAEAIDLGRDPETGKRKQITRRGFESKKDAENAAAQLLLKSKKANISNLNKSL